jgi:hypothetical protein
MDRTVSHNEVGTSRSKRLKAVELVLLMNTGRPSTSTSEQNMGRAQEMIPQASNFNFSKVILVSINDFL